MLAYILLKHHDHRIKHYCSHLNLAEFQYSCIQALCCWTKKKCNTSIQISILPRDCNFRNCDTRTNRSFAVDDGGYCTPAEEVQTDWSKQVENLRLDDEQEFPAVTRLYS